MTTAWKKLKISISPGQTEDELKMIKRKEHKRTSLKLRTESSGVEHQRDGTGIGC